MSWYGKPHLEPDEPEVQEPELIGPTDGLPEVEPLPTEQPKQDPPASEESE